MKRRPLQTTIMSLGRIVGASPAENRYYVLVFFDITNAKKYRMLMRIIKRYATRIQKSVFEAYLKPVQLKEMTDSIEKLMSSELYFNPDDNIRIYRIATNCTATIFGSCNTVSDEDDIFI